MNIPEDEVLAVLDAVDRGEVTTLEADRAHCGNVYAGDCWFTLSNGWRIEVRKDDDKFNHVRAFQAPGDKACEVAFVAWLHPTDAWGSVLNWMPSGPDAAMRAWGITE